jgi:uncharacterized membrane protein
MSIIVSKTKLPSTTNKNIDELYLFYKNREKSLFLTVLIFVFSSTVALILGIKYNYYTLAYICFFFGAIIVSISLFSNFVNYHNPKLALRKIRIDQRKKPNGIKFRIERFLLGCFVLLLAAVPFINMQKDKGAGAQELNDEANSKFNKAREEASKTQTGNNRKKEDNKVKVKKVSASAAVNNKSL